MGKINKKSDFTPTPKAGKIAAIYVRVSKKEFKRNADGEKEYRQSVKNQKEDAIKFCNDQKPPWEYELYDKDCELSGTFVAGQKTPKGSNKVRPDLDRLLKDVQAGRIHTIIVRDIARFARNLRHLLEIVDEILVPLGVALKGLDSALDITTPEGRLVVGTLAGFAQYQIDSTKKASMRGREGLAEEGKLTLGANTYGYSREAITDRIVINPTEVDVVKRVFSMYLNDKKSCRKIANILNEEKTRTKFHGIKSDKRDFTDSMWKDHQIWKMIQNPRYIGKITYNGQQCDSPFPPVIDPKIWEAAQIERNSREGIPPGVLGNQKLLCGILKCGYCLQDYAAKRAKGWNISPSMIVSSTMTTATKNKPAERIHYYACQTRTMVNSEYCRGIRVPKKKIEEAIELWIGGSAEKEFSKSLINEPQTVNRIESELNTLRHQLDKLTRKQDALSKKFLEAEGMDVDQLLETSAACKKSIAAIEAQIREYERQLSDASHEDAKNAFGILKKWKALDAQTKKVAIRKVLQQAVMYDDRLELFVGNKDNRPAIIKYKTRDKRSKEKFFDLVTDQWPVYEGEDKVLRHGAELGDGLKAYID